MSSPEGGEWSAVPGLAPPDEGVGEKRTLEVDGEVFELRSDGRGGTHYDWVSGPNRDYGFTASPSPASTKDDIEQIRGFLAIIDPATGYIADE